MDGDSAVGARANPSRVLDCVVAGGCCISGTKRLPSMPDLDCPDAATIALVEVQHHAHTSILAGGGKKIMQFPCTQLTAHAKSKGEGWTMLVTGTAWRSSCNPVKKCAH